MRYGWGLEVSMVWAIAGLAISAHADVVGPDAEDCPPGAIGTSNHGGPFCVPTACEDGCLPDAKCKRLGLCVLEEERACGGMTDPNEPCTYTHIEATGSCATGADCQPGTTCQVEDRCELSGSAGGGKDSGDLGCSSLGSLPTLAWGGALLGLVLLGLRRSGAA